MLRNNEFNTGPFCQYLSRFLFLHLVEDDLRQEVHAANHLTMRGLHASPHSLFFRPDKYNSQWEGLPVDSDRFAALRARFPRLDPDFVPEPYLGVFSRHVAALGIVDVPSQISKQNARTYFQAVKQAIEAENVLTALLQPVPVHGGRAAGRGRGGV